MAKFYFRVLTSNHATYAYSVEAPDQKTADASIAAYPDVLESEPIRAEDIPSELWEGQHTSLKPGQEVRVKSLPSSIDGEITKILPEPDGTDTVIIQISIRRRASDLELIPTSPTAEVSATEARRAAAFKAWEANPSDPNGVEALRACTAGTRVAEGSTKLNFRLLLCVLQRALHPLRRASAETARYVASVAKRYRRQVAAAAFQRSYPA